MLKLKKKLYIMCAIKRFDFFDSGLKIKAALSFPNLYQIDCIAKHDADDFQIMLHFPPKKLFAPAVLVVSAFKQFKCIHGYYKAIKILKFGSK